MHNVKMHKPILLDIGINPGDVPFFAFSCFWEMLDGQAFLDTGVICGFLPALEHLDSSPMDKTEEKCYPVFTPGSIEGHKEL